jgi:ketosteroid isomerase-like protein
MGALLTALLLTAARGGVAADEAAIRTLYKTFDEAFERQDISSVEPLFAAEYAATLADGSTSGRDEALADIREESDGATPPIHCKEQLKKITVEGDAATVQVAEETSYQVHSADGRLHTYKYTESYQDQLEKTDGHWRLRSTHYEKEADELLDGKPIGHGELKKLLALAGSDEGQIRDLYQRADSAFEKKDLEGLVQAHAIDWTVSVGDDATPHDAAIASVRHETEAALVPVHRHTEVKKVTTDGDSAQAELSCDTSYGVKGADGKAHTLRYVQAISDRLARSGDKWLIQATRLSDSGATFWDGKASSRDDVKKLLGQ